MNTNQVKAFCDSATKLLPQIGEYAATDHEQRKPDDDTLVRQLRVAASALANLTIEVARMTPPQRSMPAAPPAISAPS